MATGTDTSLTPSLEAMLGPQMTAEQARAIYEQGPEATIFALLTLAKLIRQMKERAPFLCQNCAGTRWLQARESLSPKQIPQVWSQRTLNYSVAQFQKNLGCGTRSHLFFVFRFVDMLADEGHHISRLLHSR